MSRPCGWRCTNWSRAYWMLACNQLVIVAALALFASEFVRVSRDTCYELDIVLPALSRTYLTRLGPTGILALSGMAAVVIAAMALIRTRFASVLIASFVFVAIVIFLLFAFASSYYPLWATLRNFAN